MRGDLEGTTARDEGIEGTAPLRYGAGASQRL